MNTALRVPETLLWLALFSATLMPVIRLLRGSERRLDIMWACVWFGTTNRITFNIVGLYSKGSVVAANLLHLQATIVALLTLAVVVHLQKSDR